MARLIFIVKNIGMTFFFFRLRSLIKSKINDGEMEQVITIKKQEWTESGNMEKVETRVTLGEYDEDFLWSWGKSNGLTMSFIIGLHYWKGYTTPLVISSIMAINSFREFQLYRVHIKGETEEDEPALKRPWVNQNDFYEQWMEQAGKANWNTATTLEDTSKKVSTKSLKAKQKSGALNEKKAK